MKRRVVWIALTFLMLIALILPSCASSTTTSTTIATTPATTQTTVKTTSTTPATTSTTRVTTTSTSATTGNWWDSLGTPQYGGTLTFRATSDPQGWDYYVCYSNAPWDLYQSVLFNMDWALNRTTWDYKGRWAPDDYSKGDIMQGWELSSDMTAVTCHMKQGVRWGLDTTSEASRLVNGRELTADDVAYSFNRMNALAGFKKGAWSAPDMGNIVSVTATDKYTVVFSFKSPSPWYPDTLIAPLDVNGVIPKEVVDKYGDMNNWHNAVGTGPYFVSDFVSGSSGTVTRNPNYWGYDERYPKNQLPYINKITYLIIPDFSTSLAAVRTGKIDICEGLTWSQAASVAKTNPELLQVTRPAVGYTLDYRDDNAPFTDIRVRQAIQEAIDLPTIAKTYYGGTVDGVPVGEIATSWNGWYTPYAQWPQDLKDKYAYNPTAAKKLLADAGFPNGFKTNIVTSVTYDNELLQAYKSYLSAVGIDMSINTMDYPGFLSFTNLKKQDQIEYNGSVSILFPPTRLIARFNTGQGANADNVSDPAYDAIFNKFMMTSDPVQQKSLMKDADMYAISHFFHLNALPTVNYVLYQQWLKGFQGEELIYWPKISMARYWIDQGLKKSLGH